MRSTLWPRKTMGVESKMSNFSDSVFTKNFDNIEASRKLGEYSETTRRGLYLIIFLIPTSYKL